MSQTLTARCSCGAELSVLLPADPAQQLALHQSVALSMADHEARCSGRSTLVVDLDQLPTLMKALRAVDPPAVRVNAPGGTS